MRTDRHDSIVNLAVTLGAAKNLYFVLRIQSRKDMTVQINNGKTEEISTGSLEGIGLQVFNQQGFSGFAASDQISEPIVTDLFEKASFLAEQSQSFKNEPNLEIFKLQKLTKKTEVPLHFPYSSLDLTEIEAALKKLNEEVSSIDPALAVRTLFRITDDQWRIARTDGTDVSFNTPRSVIYHSITAKSDNDTATTFANLPGRDFDVLLKPENIASIQSRARNAAHLALKLLNAKKLPGGNYKLIIDYTLAKGLAHEAFGHAVETDGLDSSILGDHGRLKTGMIVANPKLSIIDGPIEGDYAYQPVSAMGVERKTVTIVDHGKLVGGLSDIFSAQKAGVPYTGAERIESFFHLPIARMTNIRIEMDDPIPMEQPFEKVTPEDLYQVLSKHGIIKPGEEVLYLTGFHGGQVNPAFGDFVFHCSGIYKLSETPVLYKPAIFSGKILSTLTSVTTAIGALRIDATGTCGKMGQGVPSCGGSHYFLVIDKNPEILIGGE